MSLVHENHINLLFGPNVARVYYQHELYAMIITLEQIEPFTTKTIRDMARHLVKVTSKCPTVDLMFNHARGSLPKSKQRKLNGLLNLQDVDVDEKILGRWLGLLLK